MQPRLHPSGSVAHQPYVQLTHTALGAGTALAMSSAIYVTSAASRSRVQAKATHRQESLHEAAEEAPCRQGGGLERVVLPTAAGADCARARVCVWRGGGVERDVCVWWWRWWWGSCPPCTMVSSYAGRRCAAVRSICSRGGRHARSGSTCIIVMCHSLLPQQVKKARRPASAHGDKCQLLKSAAGCRRCWWHVDGWPRRGEGQAAKFQQQICEEFRMCRQLFTRMWMCRTGIDVDGLGGHAGGCATTSRHWSRALVGAHSQAG